MTTHQSILVSEGPAYTGIGPKVRKATFAVTAAIADAAADIIEMIPVYAGEMLVDLTFESTDLDTGAALLMDVGDGGDDDRFIVADNVGQSGGLVRLAQNAGHVYSADDTIDVTISTAAGTGAAGTITLIAHLI